MKKILLYFLVISLILAGCGQDKQSGDVSTAGNSEGVFVKTSPVEAGEFTHFLSLPGHLQPAEQAFITSKVNGTVQFINADIGTKVAKGQTLCKIDDTTFKLQHKKSSSDLSAEQIRYEDAEINYARMKALYEAQAISQYEFENIESQFKMAKEHINRAQYDFDLATENLNYTNITSPLAGIVSLKDVSEGENISPGNTIFAVVKTDRMYVETGVAEQDIIAIKQGQRVKVMVDSLPGNTFEGFITHIGPVPNPTTKTYPIKITLENRDDLLKPGMFATVEILLAERKASLSVPKESVITEDGQKYVFVEREGKVEKRLIEIGYSNDTHFEILNGLKNDEVVVSVGHDGLTDGSTVEIVSN
ncbi:efflux RND transporter periplasmic adaptor subunit [Desulforamulus aquiferis]|uniref:Efflux RND transporter periplasmic adaptor subunit n=1 Tax=Desulforamulus aquiferis TaxID=1397668 RepID=A0AAW7ZET1_9FIRM|nr:efflux RND transporter periplasmic adaptor subunit [Desulforamulus aquiferis]MDO7788284.1 efflux RND transporter periplasmic adaptor subunit [Desulforamulus aquiferis]RYD03477.1 hypothetical protein N752_20060 [Desulforamulus aquiferis]